MQCLWRVPLQFLDADFCRAPSDAPQKPLADRLYSMCGLCIRGPASPFNYKSESTDPSTVDTGSTPAENLEKMLKTSLRRSSPEQVHVDWLEQYVPWRIKEIPALSLFTVPNHKQCKFCKKKKREDEGKWTRKERRKMWGAGQQTKGREGNV